MRPGAAHQHSCYAFASLCEPALGKPHQVGRDVSIYSYERSNLLDWQAEIAENAEKGREARGSAIMNENTVEHTVGGTRPPPYPGAGARPPERGRSPLLVGCLVFFAAAGVVGVLIAVAVVVISLAGAAAQFGRVGVVKGRSRFEEVTISGQVGDPKVVVVPLKGVITLSEGFGLGVDPVTLFKAQLEMAREDPDVAVLLLLIDSPGGGVTGTDIMHRQVKEYRSTGKPVVACMMDVGASGAYYVACACDRIVAHPTTITGSIGVIMPLFDFSKLLSVVGVRSEGIKSGEFKDMGSPFAEKSPEQKQKERELFQGIVDEMYARFVQIVAEGRDLDEAKVREVADGRVLTGQQALDAGLIDRIGYEEDAVNLAKQMAGIATAHVVRYRRIVSLTEALVSLKGGPAVEVSLGGALDPLLQARPMYLWVPPAGQESLLSQPGARER